MSRNYEGLLEEISEALSSLTMVIEAKEAYELMPIPSKQINLDLQISSTEIRLTNIARSLRERLL